MEALTNIDLEIKENEFVGLIGTSGSPKLGAEEETKTHHLITSRREYFRILPLPPRYHPLLTPLFVLNPSKQRRPR